MRPEQFLTHSLQDQRISRILHAAVEAVEPAALVTRFLEEINLPRHERLYLLALGKAAEPMIVAAADALPGFELGFAVTKLRGAVTRPRITVVEAGHPIPDLRSIAAGNAALEFAAGLREEDLLICLISGGGSALVAAPFPGVTLEDLQALTQAALASGASIHEVNILRRQLDRVKGGGLAAATRARVVSLILSDVIGDPLEAIASGPTADNPTGAADALGIVSRYRLEISPTMERVLHSQDADRRPARHQHVANHVIGNNALALRAALSQAKTDGFEAMIIDDALGGEAAEVGRSMAARLAAATVGAPRPFCWLAGGETTVTLGSSGKGGRNQELALAAVDTLAGRRDCLLVALATDGNDGPTDAAGAVVSGRTAARASALGLSPADHLARHDSYAFFGAMDDLLKPGYTGTNVNDIVILLGL